VLKDVAFFSNNIFVSAWAKKVCYGSCSDKACSPASRVLVCC